MTTGKKPSIIVVREFRGTRLYLVKVTRAPKGYAWTSDRSKALHVDYDTAAAYVREAAADYGATCAAIDSDGTVTAAPLAALRYHVTGAIERVEKISETVTDIPLSDNMEYVT